MPTAQEINPNNYVSGDPIQIWNGYTFKMHSHFQVKLHTACTMSSCQNTCILIEFIRGYNSTLQSSRLPVFYGTRLIGYQWSPKTHEIKDFLTRNNIPYQWLDYEKNEEDLDLSKKKEHIGSCLGVRDYFLAPIDTSDE